MNFLHHTNKKQLIIAVIILGFCISMHAPSGSVGAQSTSPVTNNIEQGLRDKFKALCDRVKEIDPSNSKNLPLLCQSYPRKGAQDNAANRLCRAYGNKVKSQCDDYKNYEPGSGRQPEAGGSVVPTKVEPEPDPALECVENRDKCDLIGKYVNPIIGFLSALVGVAVTIGIISGGIRYAGAEDNPQKISAAKKQIGTAIIALLAYLFLYLILRWLSPQL